MPSTSTKPPEQGNGWRWRQWFAATQAVSPAEACRIALAAGLAIGLTGWISSGFIDGMGLSVLLASMGASTVILFCVPASPMARTWPLLGGHLLSGVTGIACSALPWGGWVCAGLAVGLAILVMQLARCLHPPGGASALVAVLGGGPSLGWSFLAAPLALNVLVLLALSKLLNRRPQTVPAQQPASRPALERLGIRRGDLRAALVELNAFVDVSETQLGEIYDLAAAAALQRELGAMTCGDIMTSDPVSVEFGTELEETWTLMQRHRIKAISVVDRAGHVLGILTLTDFFRHARMEKVEGLGDRLRRLLRATPQTTSEKPEVAGQIMTSPVISLRRDAPVADLALLLTTRGIHQAPIVDDRDKLVGIVSQTDLIAALYRSLSARNLSAPGSGSKEAA
jgi:CBS domain-containing membrane protein